MLFNSYFFLYGFLPITLIVYYLLKDNTKRLLWLTACSYYFYSFWNFKLAFLILFSTMIDYVAGKKIASLSRPYEKKKWLIVSIVTNLGLLFFFKYFNFFLDSANKVLTLLGGDVYFSHLNIILPVGISFYTFQSMSYTIDLYRGNVKPVKNFLHFACFVSLFPQLIAGPIVRFSDLASQLEDRIINENKIARGICLFIVGLFKKVFVADSMAIIVNALWETPDITFIAAWIVVLAYSIQIYFDFSGYSDMACGLGLFFGFEFPQNFNSPYKAISISDFWRRWHMTLSQWLRDFLYIPLGGNKKGRFATYRNLLITMVLGGLWHGAQWTFLFWGAYHGILLSIERLFLNKRKEGITSVVGLNRGITFFCVVVGWVLFRSLDLEQTVNIYRGMFGLNGFFVAQQLNTMPNILLVLLGVYLLGVFSLKNTWEIHWSYSKRSAIGLCALYAVIIVIILINFQSPFLYFQF